MEVTIVCDKAPGLGGAATIAERLQRAKQIQLWTLSDEVPGIVLKLYASSACTVIEQGGHDAYQAAILAEFENAGYKRYVPGTPPVVTVRPRMKKTEMENN